jgi:hypothetical protein
MRETTLEGPNGLRIRAHVPEGWRERARGLLGRDGLTPGQAMLFERARSVHTFGMRFTIRVAVLDRRLRVLAVVRLPPSRILLPRPGGRHLLEGREDLGLRRGDRLSTAGVVEAGG